MVKKEDAAGGGFNLNKGPGEDNDTGSQESFKIIKKGTSDIIKEDSLKIDKKTPGQEIPEIKKYNPVVLPEESRDDAPEDDSPFNQGRWRSFYENNKKMLINGAAALVCLISLLAFVKISCPAHIPPEATFNYRTGKMAITTETATKYKVKWGDTYTKIAQDFFNIPKGNEPKITAAINAMEKYDKEKNPDYNPASYADTKSVSKGRVIRKPDGRRGDNLKAGQEIYMHSTRTDTVEYSYLERIIDGDTTKVMMDKKTPLNLEEKAKKMLGPNETLKRYHILARHEEKFSKPGRKDEIQYSIEKTITSPLASKDEIFSASPNTGQYRLSDYKGIERANRLELITNIYMTADSLKGAKEEIAAKFGVGKISVSQIYYAVNKYSEKIGRSPIRRSNAMDRIEYHKAFAA